jgi:hypothetical protein
MSVRITFLFRLKFFIRKRITPLAERWWDIKSILYGYRKKRYAKRYGEPIDMGGKQHLHIYPTLYCHLDCFFCQNKFYLDYSKPKYTMPKFSGTSAKEWASWLNRMYNIHHLDVNGGEPFNNKEFIKLLNLLDHHNIVIFTNLPGHAVDKLKDIDTKKNNIQMICSYHPLDEPRSVLQFAMDFHKIPAGLKPTLQIIDVPEVSCQDNASAFLRLGIHTKINNAHTPTKNNPIEDKNFKKALCHSDIDCVAPDLTVYRCLGLMLRNVGGAHISKYEFSNEAQWCNYYGLCGPCSLQADIYEIKI